MALEQWREDAFRCDAQELPFCDLDNDALRKTMIAMDFHETRPFRLLDLPVEIRQKIYGLFEPLEQVKIEPHPSLDSNGVVTTTSYRVKAPSRSCRRLSLLLACRAILTEAAPILFSGTSCVVFGPIGANPLHNSRSFSPLAAVVQVVVGDFFLDVNDALEVDETLALVGRHCPQVHCINLRAYGDDALALAWTSLPRVLAIVQFRRVQVLLYITIKEEACLMDLSLEYFDELANGDPHVEWPPSLTTIRIATEATHVEAAICCVEFLAAENCHVGKETKGEPDKPHTITLSRTPKELLR